MLRTCIICGHAAGSGEHVFPAALGGRRVNRGIYCEQHDNQFSRHVSVLAPQLENINALLGVRHDREKHPRIVTKTTAAGDDVIISKGVVRRSLASAIDQDKVIHLEMVLGGPDGLQALAYVALTFFAHLLPEEARQPGLDAIKSFIQNQAQNTFAWWESTTTTDNLPPNPFEFGHTIMVTTEAESGEAFALISLFQALTVGVALGRIENAVDRTITVFLDPHAERAPLDLQQTEASTVEIRIRKPDPLHAHLEHMVRGGGGDRLLKALFAKIERWHFRTEMSSPLARLNATSTLQGRQRLDAIVEVLEEQAGRIHRLMKVVVNDFVAQPGDPKSMAPVIAALRSQIAVDNGVPRPETEDAILRAIVAFAREIYIALESAPIDIDFLWSLFSSGKGAGIVGEEMFKAIEEALEFMSNPRR